MHAPPRKLDSGSLEVGIGDTHSPIATEIPCRKEESLTLRADPAPSELGLPTGPLQWHLTSPLNRWRRVNTEPIAATHTLFCALNFEALS